MTSMSIRRRLAAGIAGAFVAATALVATTAGAAHAATCATTVTLTPLYKINEFRDYNSLSARTTSTCGTPFNGTTVIERWTGTAWVQTTTSSGASYASYSGSDRFNATATYRARYSGGASSSDTWTPGASANVRINVIRLVKVTDRSTSRASVGVFGIKPAASIARKVALFQVRKGGTWRAYKRVRVPNNGVLRVAFANSRTGIKYRMILPAAGGFVKSVHGPITARRY